MAFIGLGGIGRIKGDPQEDKAAIVIIALLGEIQPAQCAVHTQAQIGLLQVALLPMPRLQCCVVHALSSCL